MASSERRVAANRANAQRSTGPRTDAGKRKVSRNAMVYAFTARGALLARDDVRDYQRFARRLLRDLNPDGAMQEQLAEEIVNYSWRLRRVPRAERLLFDKYHRFYDPEPKMDPLLVDELLEEEEAEGPRPEEDILGFDDVVTDQTPSGLMCHMLEERDRRRNEPDSPVWRLDRYADRLERARASALRLLLALQRRKPREPEDEVIDEDDELTDEEDEEVVDGESAHLSAKPQADFDELSRVAVEEPAADPAGGAQVVEQDSKLQNKPNESSTDDAAQVTACNGDAVNESCAFGPGVPGSKPNPQTLPDTTDPVEPSPSIGESPPPTT
jgi:hypothetical protein